MTTVQTRTRTRARPHTSTDASEQRVMKDPVSEHAHTKHKPTREVEAHPVRQGDAVVLVARVRITDGLTLNMGNYSSFRRDVGLELDTVLPGEVGPALTEAQLSHIDRVYEAASGWVSDKLADAVADAREYFED